MSGVRKNAQHGLSMVELLVALAISSFLILGITQVYIDNKSNYSFQQSQAANMDSGRFLQMMLNEQIGKAGYRRAPEQKADDAFKEKTPADGCAAFPEGGVVAKLDYDDSDNEGANGFCIRYQPAVGGELACDGAALSLADDSAYVAAKESELAYIIIKHVLNDDLHEGRVTCNGQNLVEGVADFQVEFLLGENTERRFQANPYKKAADYNGNDIVRGVKYSVLLASRPNQSGGMESAIFEEWKKTTDNKAKKKLEDNDSNRIYQVVSSTQVLRNLVP